MTDMLILNAVLATTIVTAILTLLGWGIVTDRARMAYRGYGRAPGLSA